MATRAGVLSLWVSVALGLTTDAATAQGYNTYFSFSGPKSVFVGQTGIYSMLFGLDTTNPPSGITSNTELYSGYVDFGAGQQRTIPPVRLSTVPGTKDEKYRTFTYQYTQEGTFQAQGFLSLHDEVCTVDGCAPYDRTFQTNILSVTAYSPNTVNDHAKLMVESARAKLIASGNTNPSDLEIARLAYSEAILFRERDAATSANPAYRDVEYMLRGYAGGLLLRSASPGEFGSDGDLANDLANASGPVGSVIYNGTKLWDYLTGQSSSSNGLPASPPGGIESNLHGWLSGLSGDSFDELLSDPTYDEPIAKPSSADNPIMPDGKLFTSATGPGAFNPDYFLFDVQPGERYYIDPIAGTTDMFAVGGNLFRTLVVPFSSGYAAGSLLLGYSGKEVAINPGELFEFTTGGFGGVSEFYLKGVRDTDTPLVVDVSFSDAGRVLVLHQSGTAAVATVPEPAAWQLMCAGLLVGGFGMRRRMQQQSRATRRST
jgi:hypothetical protein